MALDVLSGGWQARRGRAGDSVAQRQNRSYVHAGRSRGGRPRPNGHAVVGAVSAVSAYSPLRSKSFSSMMGAFGAGGFGGGSRPAGTATGPAPGGRGTPSGAAPGGGGGPAPGGGGGPTPGGRGGAGATGGNLAAPEATAVPGRGPGACVGGSGGGTPFRTRSRRCSTSGPAFSNLPVSNGATTISCSEALSSTPSAARSRFAARRLRWASQPRVAPEWA